MKINLIKQEAYMNRPTARQQHSYLNKIMQGAKKFASEAYQNSGLETVVGMVNKELIKPTVDLMQGNNAGFRPAYAFGGVPDANRGFDNGYKAQTGKSGLEEVAENYLSFKKGSGETKAKKYLEIKKARKKVEKMKAKGITPNADLLKKARMK